jgi:hypothetical protein
LASIALRFSARRSASDFEDVVEVEEVDVAESWVKDAVGRSPADMLFK